MDVKMICKREINWRQESDRKKVRGKRTGLANNASIAVAVDDMWVLALIANIKQTVFPLSFLLDLRPPPLKLVQIRSTSIRRRRRCSHSVSVSVGPFALGTINLDIRRELCRRQVDDTRLSEGRGDEWRAAAAKGSSPVLVVHLIRD